MTVPAKSGLSGLQQRQLFNTSRLAGALVGMSAQRIASDALWSSGSASAGMRLVRAGNRVLSL